MATVTEETSPAPEVGLRNRGQPSEVAENEHSQETPVNEKSGKRHRKPGGCCRWFFASFWWKAITFTIVGATPVWGIVMALPTLLQKLHCDSYFCQLRHWCLSLWLAVQFLYNFAMAQHVNPGGTTGVKPQFEASGQFVLHLDGDERRDGEAMLFAPNFCELCQNWKPPRSHHCSTCGQCVLRMDHHCPWLGNCVGMRNHGHFVLMYVFAIVGLTYAIVLCVSAIALENHNSHTMAPVKDAFRGSAVHFQSGGGGLSLSKLPMVLSPGMAGIATLLSAKVLVVVGLEVAIMTILTTIALIVVLSFGCPAIYFGSSGMTIIENRFPMKEYVQLKEKIYCPLGPGFYQRRRDENMREILGNDWWLRLLLPVRGAVDMRASVAPLASINGATLLKQRISEVESQGCQHEVGSVKQLGINPGPFEKTSSAA